MPALEVWPGQKLMTENGFLGYFFSLPVTSYEKSPNCILFMHLEVIYRHSLMAQSVLHLSLWGCSPTEGAWPPLVAGWKSWEVSGFGAPLMWMDGSCCMSTQLPCLGWHSPEACSAVSQWVSCVTEPDAHSDHSLIIKLVLTFLPSLSPSLSFLGSPCKLTNWSPILISGSALWENVRLTLTFSYSQEICISVYTVVSWNGWVRFSGDTLWNLLHYVITVLLVSCSGDFLNRKREEIIVSAMLSNPQVVMVKEFQ